MRFLAIDHGTRTGYCLLCDDIVVNTGTINVVTVPETAITKYADNICELIRDSKPDVVVMEETKHIRNAKVLRYLMILYSIIKVEAYRYGAKVYEVNPKVMKKYITGNGNADKKEVMEALIRDFNIDESLIFRPVYYKNREKGIKTHYFDESDATALAVYAKESFKGIEDIF